MKIPPRYGTRRRTLLFPVSCPFLIAGEATPTPQAGSISNVAKLQDVKKGGPRNRALQEETSGEGGPEKGRSETTRPVPPALLLPPTRPEP